MIRTGKAWILTALILLTAGIQSHGQTSNDPDRPYRNSQPHGRWTIWFDSPRTQAESTGRYRHGRECGTWRYFHPSGRLLKKERYKGTLIRTHYYHDSGHLKSKGNARLIPEEEYLHYFIDGKWKEYDDRGRRTGTVWYSNGEETGRKGR
jgi:antitoxin component YwqK of YwqJK toxin-antitoxin module